MKLKVIFKIFLLNAKLNPVSVPQTKAHHYLLKSFSLMRLSVALFSSELELRFEFLACCSPS